MSDWRYGRQGRSPRNISWRGSREKSFTMDDLLASGAYKAGSDLPADVAKVTGFADNHVNFVRGGLLLFKNGHTGLPDWFEPTLIERRALILQKGTDLYPQLTGLLAELWGLSGLPDIRDAVNIVCAIVYELGAEMQCSYELCDVGQYTSMMSAQFRNLLARQVSVQSQLSPAALQMLSRSAMASGGALPQERDWIDRATVAAGRLGKLAGEYDREKYRGLKEDTRVKVGPGGAEVETKRQGPDERPPQPAPSRGRRVVMGSEDGLDTFGPAPGGDEA